MQGAEETRMELYKPSAALPTEEASFGLGGDPTGGPCLVIIPYGSIPLDNSLVATAHLVIFTFPFQGLMGQPVMTSVSEL